MASTFLLMSEMHRGPLISYSSAKKNSKLIFCSPALFSRVSSTLAKLNSSSRDETRTIKLYLNIWISVVVVFNLVDRLIQIYLCFQCLKINKCYERSIIEEISKAIITIKNEHSFTSSTLWYHFTCFRVTWFRLWYQKQNLSKN